MGNAQRVNEIQGFIREWQGEVESLERAAEICEEYGLFRLAVDLRGTALSLGGAVRASQRAAVELISTGSGEGCL